MQLVARDVQVVNFKGSIQDCQLHAQFLGMLCLDPLRAPCLVVQAQSLVLKRLDHGKQRSASRNTLTSRITPVLARKYVGVAFAFFAKGMTARFGSTVRICYALSLAPLSRVEWHHYGSYSVRS
jgi:hypothetical protein